MKKHAEKIKDMQRTIEDKDRKNRENRGVIKTLQEKIEVKQKKQD